MTIIDIAIGCSLLVSILLFALYICYCIIRPVYIWITDELIPAIFGEDNDHRWD